MSPSTKVMWMHHVLALFSIVSNTGWVSALSQQSSLKVRVCTGCVQKCRGSFNHLTSFEKLADSENDNGAIEIEETFCMNQCKKGPNVRIINADNENVLTFDDTIMNEMESSRKSFQRVSNEDRVNYVWGIASGVVEGELTADEKGSVDKLHDIMPKQ